MYAITIGNNVLKRYKLQWYSYNSNRCYVKKTMILHSTSLDTVKRQAILLYGSMPDNIIRI